eukprot:scaffold771_cov387-Prasinococcus_capsulatus_cf.AAC.3
MALQATLPRLACTLLHRQEHMAHKTESLDDRQPPAYEEDSDEVLTIKPSTPLRRKRPIADNSQAPLPTPSRARKALDFDRTNESEVVSTHGPQDQLETDANNGPESQGALGRAAPEQSEKLDYPNGLAKGPGEEPGRPQEQRIPKPARMFTMEVTNNTSFNFDRAFRTLSRVAVGQVADALTLTLLPLPWLNSRSG